MKTVEVLFFGGCPHIEVAAERARDAIDRTGVDAEVHLVRVEGDADASRLHFLGSPTIRVDGRDVDDSAITRTDFGLQCRVYSIDGRLAGVPPVEWIEAALRDSQRK
jgi:hypothetical protein